VLACLAVVAAAVTPVGGAQATPPTASAGGSTPYDRTVKLVSRRLGAPGVDERTVGAARADRHGVHAVVQLHTLPKPGDLERLAELGVRPLAYLNGATDLGTAYLAALSPSVRDSDELRSLVRMVAGLLPQDKIDTVLARGSGGAEVVISFFGDVSADRSAAVLSAAGVAARQTSSDSFVATLTRGQIQRLATEDAVQFLAPVPGADHLELGTSRSLSNVDQLQRFDVPSATYLGLSGLGTEVSIHDNGLDDTHGDFANRIISNTATLSGDHGTHVTSILAGSGAMSDQNNDANTANPGPAFQYRGVAPQARIRTSNSQTAHDAPTMTTAVVTDGADASNHSYGYNSGQYDGNMQTIDRIIRGDEARNPANATAPNIPARPMVFSAGNAGDVVRGTALNAGYFALSKSCKNCIMVANLRANGQQDGSSSAGPTPDGRLKPDLGAFGANVTAAGARVDLNNNPATGNSYRAMGGTSMASPVVTGTLALMLQRYADRFGVNLETTRPRPSTLKAMLLQSARDQQGTGDINNRDTGAPSVYGPGPDWATGYGLLDAQAAVGLIDTKRFVEDEVSVAAHTKEHLVSVVPGQSELKVTLAWDDLPAHRTPISRPASWSTIWTCCSSGRRTRSSGRSFCLPRLPATVTPAPPACRPTATPLRTAARGRPLRRPSTPLPARPAEQRRAGRRGQPGGRAVEGAGERAQHRRQPAAPLAGTQPYALAGVTTTGPTWVTRRPLPTRDRR
jgi:subtilisin family serine protease